MTYAIVFGGASFEHEISIVSAIAVKSALKADLRFVFLDKERDFYLIPNEKMRANFFSSGGYKSCKKLRLTHGGFTLAGGLFGGEKPLGAECVINLIHGADGEDGKLAGLFEFYGVRCIGPRLEASVMSFNKILTKLLAQKCGVPTLPYEVIVRDGAGFGGENCGAAGGNVGVDFGAAGGSNSNLDGAVGKNAATGENGENGANLNLNLTNANGINSNLTATAQILAQTPAQTIVKTTPTLPFPFILKPARLGSSIGVSVVKGADELDYALDLAFEFDHEVLAEPFVAGVREFNLAGYARADGELVFSRIEEPAKREFLDFEQKYTGFTQRAAGEADVSDGLKTALRAAFARLYLGGDFAGALVRCDFFVIDGAVVLNEINPNPGSLANYLFDDFTAAVGELAAAVKPPRKIAVEYNFINQITHGKGKLA